MNPKKPRNPIFSKDKVALAEMLELRKQGWGLLELGVKYNVDKKCVHQWCMKMGVHVRKSSKPKSKPGPKPKLVRTQLDNVDEFGEKINLGHNYQWYLKKAGIIHRKPKDVL